MTDFKYTLISGWQDAEKTRADAFFSRLKPHQKLLLLSDGSMTLELELLYNGRVEVELKHQALIHVPANAASYLEVTKDNKALEREVWLKVNGQRLVYAHSLIPLEYIDDKLYEALEKDSLEPLGRMLSSRRILFTKERLEAGVVRCEKAAKELGLEKEAPFVARRYILLNCDIPKKCVIKAAVTEIFAPDIIEAAPVNA